MAGHGRRRLREPSLVVTADRLRHRAGVDSDRTGQFAQSARGAAVDTEIEESAPEIVVLALCIPRLIEALQLTRADDALPRRDGQAARRAHRFAEAALDAAINQRVGRQHGLEILEVNIPVLVENDTGIEQTLRVEQPLDAPHQVGGLLAPLHLDEGRHVAPSAVFGLERSVIAPDNDLGDLLHQGGVTADRLIVGKTLRKDEVQVSVERMTEDNGLGIAVPDESSLQVGGCRSKAFDGNGDIFNDNRRTDGPYRAYGGKQPLANFPVFLDQIRIRTEFDRTGWRRF